MNKGHNEWLSVTDRSEALNYPYVVCVTRHFDSCKLGILLT